MLLNDSTSFSSNDDSFRLRYGLYETYLYKNNAIEHENLHWERLLSGLKLLGFVIPSNYSATFFGKQIHELATKNQLPDLSRIRLQIFSEDTFAPFEPQYLIEIFELEAATTQWPSEGISVDVLTPFFKEINAISNCKISHNKHFILARKTMAEQQLDDVLLCNTQGNIIESAIANIFWIKNKKVFTPPLSEGCLAGTMRSFLIEILIKNQIPFEEKRMTVEELNTADELFLTNGIRKIRWIQQVGRQHFECNFLQQLREKGIFDTIYL